MALNFYCKYESFEYQYHLIIDFLIIYETNVSFNKVLTVQPIFKVMGIVRIRHVRRSISYWFFKQNMRNFKSLEYLKSSLKR